MNQAVKNVLFGQLSIPESVIFIFQSFQKFFIIFHLTHWWFSSQSKTKTLISQSYDCESKTLISSKCSDIPLVTIILWSLKSMDSIVREVYQFKVLSFYLISRSHDQKLKKNQEQGDCEDQLSSTFLMKFQCEVPTHWLVVKKIYLKKQILTDIRQRWMVYLNPFYKVDSDRWP